MVPKVLHYIWIGGEKTDLANKCIESYHQYMPDYKIVEWNESNIDFNWLDDIGKKFYKDNYDNKKFAFCADLVRLYILKNFGGIYVDADVEFIKHLPDEFLSTPLIGRIKPRNTVCNGCLWGCEKDDKLVQALTKWFLHHISLGEKTHGHKWIFNTILKNFFELFGDDKNDKVIEEFHGYKIYPTEYFCPMDGLSFTTTLTDKTISIHHFELSWKDKK